MKNLAGDDQSILALIDEYFEYRAKMLGDILSHCDKIEKNLKEFV